MGSKARFWQRIEGDRQPEAEDAGHWIHVYQELLSTLRSMRETGAGDQARIEALIHVFERREQFWTAILHDAPVHAARRQRRRASGRRRRDSA